MGLVQDVEKLFGSFGANTNQEQILIRILKCVAEITPAAGGLATEATQLDVLSAIDSMRDYEVRLAVDSDATPVTWLEVRYWDAQSGALGAPVYYLPGSIIPGVPVGSLSYINPNTLLTQLLGQLMSLNAVDFATEVTLAAIKVDTGNMLTSLATEVTLLDVETAIDSLLTAFNAEDFASQTTLAALLTELQAKADLTETQPVSLATSVRTPSYDIVTTLGAGSVAAGARSVSIKNNGLVSVTVLGTLLPVGESIGFDAGGQGDTLGAITYNIPATGSLQIIKTV